MLIAVVLTIIVSAALSFEHKTKGAPEHIADPTARELVATYAATDKKILALGIESTTLSAQARQAQKVKDARAVADLDYKIELMKLDIATLSAENKTRMHDIRSIQFERAKADEKASATLYLVGQVPAGIETDGRHWHIKKIDKGAVNLVGGGDVVGLVPSGLPSFRLPPLSLDAILSLLSAAFIIALVAFMESISMAKALAAQTKQRLDPNQELIGQGLANIGGAPASRWCSTVSSWRSPCCS